jgi:hypothetical protein
MRKVADVAGGSGAAELPGTAMGKPYRPLNLDPS